MVLVLSVKGMNYQAGDLQTLLPAACLKLINQFVMKKFIFILLVIMGVYRSVGAAVVRGVEVSTVKQDSKHQHQVQKKHVRHRRQVSKTHNHRMRKQLRQADKHLRDDKKVQRTQHELKKEEQH